MTVTEEERYLFDLQGFLVVRGALSATEVAALNEAIDGHAERPADGRTRTGLSNFFTWHEGFRTLLDHPSVLPYLEAWVDPAVRVDLCYGQMQVAGDAQLDLHLGGTPYQPVASYLFRNGRPYCGLTVVSWALTDAPAGAGGFACIPGSHKANYDCPKDIRSFERDPGIVVQPELRAGDAVIFTEALTHGTLPWTHPAERRVLFYRYTPGYMTFERHDYPEDVLTLMTARQRALLEPAYTRTQVYENGKRTGEQSRPPVTLRAQTD